MKKLLLFIGLSVLLFSSYASTPFTIEAAGDGGLPKTVLVDQTLHLHYKLVNNAAAPADYRLTLDDAPGITHEGGNCNTTGADATLLAQQFCTIDIEFVTGSDAIFYNHNILTATFVPMGGKTILNFTRQITEASEQVIVFGDSLLALDSNFQGSTNNDPEVGRKNWVEDIAPEIGSPEKAFVIRHDSSVNPHNQNVDYALGGARTYTPPAGGVKGLGDQVQRYADDLQKYGVAPNDSTKVILWMGGNDFLNALTDPGSQVVPAVNHIEAALEKISELGVKEQNIYVVNLPDLGKIPSILAPPASHSVKLSQATVTFNEDLSTLLTDEFPKVNLIDEYTNSNDILANPSGYEAPGHPAFDDDKKDLACGSGSTENACDGYIFWDGVHPTVASHLLIAKMISDCVWDGTCATRSS